MRERLMAYFPARKTLTLLFMTSLLVLLNASFAEVDENAPDIITSEDTRQMPEEESREREEAVEESAVEEERDLICEGEQEDDDDQTPDVQEIREDEEKQREEVVEQNVEVAVETDENVMTTDQPSNVLEPPTEPPQATPPNLETPPTDLEVPEAEPELPLADVEASEATPPGEEGEGDDVPTFTEFSQRKRMEQNSTQRLASEKPAVVSGGKNNYASIDCGAKIVACNGEAQNPSAILSENKDVYMINPCSADIWFVVELCELVELHTLQIACFELFSSIPENFNVFVSERYPADEWRSLGTLHARNEREIQSFPLSVEQSSYAKFLKVQMVSHYGSEHFCPLSLLRVNGASMMEVYEYSESQQEVLAESLSPTVAPYDGGEEMEDELFGDVLEGNISQELGSGGRGTGLPQMLAGAVRSLFETVGGYMARQEATPPTPENPTPDNEDESESVSPASVHPTSSPESSEAASDDTSSEDVVTSQSETYGKTEESPETHSTSDFATSSDQFESKTHSETSVPLSGIAEPTLEATPTITETPPTPLPGSESLDDPVIETESVEPVSGSVAENGTTVEDNSTAAVSSGGTVAPHSDDVDQELADSAVESGVGVDAEMERETESEGEQVGGTVVDDPKLEEDGERDQETSGSTVEGDGDEEKDGGNGFEPTATVGDGDERIEGEGEREGEGKDVNQTVSRAEVVTTEESLREADGEGEGDGVSEADGEGEGDGVSGGGGEGGDLAEREGAHETLTNGNGAGGLSGQPKEKSVFLRLSNRIRDLEENMSLFSSYLDQISTGMKRNKNRTEDGQRVLERKLGNLNESLQMATDQTELALAVLAGLHGNLQEIRDAVWVISDDLQNSRRELLLLVGVLVVTLLLLLAVSIATILWLLCNKTTLSHASHVTLKNTKEIETHTDKFDKPSNDSGAGPLANGLIPTATHITNGCGLLGATENRNALELDESLQTEPWSRVARKRRKKPKTL